MKNLTVSELISKLRALEEKYGDLEVVYETTPEGGGRIFDAQPVYFPGTKNDPDRKPYLLEIV